MEPKLFLYILALYFIKATLGACLSGSVEVWTGDDVTLLL